MSLQKLTKEETALFISKRFLNTFTSLEMWGHFLMKFELYAFSKPVVNFYLIFVLK